MKNIGFSEEEINQIMNITVAILLLGNVEFDTISKPGVGDISSISKNSEALIDQISSLLMLEKD
jgi:myosin heavy subunit